MEGDKVQKSWSIRFIMWICSHLILWGVLIGLGMFVGLIAGGLFDVKLDGFEDREMKEIVEGGMKYLVGMMFRLLSI